MEQQREPAGRQVTVSCGRRWAAVLSAALVIQALAGCGMSVQVQASAANAGGGATSTAPSTATPVATATATPVPTATATPMATATPEATATAEAGVTRQWSQAVQRVGDINGALADLGTKFNNGSISMQQGGGELQSLDQQAATVNSTIQALPPLPGASDATVGHYRQSVSNWSGAIHNLDDAVGKNDIFSAPGLADKLEAIAQDLDQQGVNLHLPPST